MAFFLKYFNQHADYEAYMSSDNVLLPNVSMCADDESWTIHYNPHVEPPIIVSTTYNVETDGLTRIIGGFGYEASPVSAVKNIWIDGNNSPIVEEVFLSEGEHHIDYEFFDYEAIPAGMFCYLQQLRSVVIPEGVVEIGVGALAYSPLETLSIPESVKNLGEYAVSSDFSEEVFEIVDGVIYLDKIALGFYPDETYDTEQPVVIREGTKFIMSDFAYSEFSSISISDSVISIGEGALNNCLDQTIEDGIVYVGNVAIGVDYESWDSDTVVFKEGTRIICDGLFQYYDMIKSVVIPDSVVTIGNSAFRSCYNLESVTLGEGVKYIGSSAFEDTLVENIEISDNVEYIGSRAFICYPKSIVVSSNNKFYDSRNACNALIRTKTNKLIIGCDDTVIPNGVKVIGEAAFGGLVEITTITIPNSVTRIENSAFYGCSGLTSVTIGNGVTSIGDDAFTSCINLTSINIPGNVKSIGSGIFGDCSNLTTVVIQEGLTIIGEDAFRDCECLTSITIPDSVTHIGSRAFSGCTLLQIIDNIRYADCYAIEVIDKNLSSYTIKEGTRFIGENVFSSCSVMTSITIPQGVMSIGESAFYGCSSLTSITIPNSVTSIGDWAFYGCEGLPSITIPNSVTNIGENTFSFCRGLTSITIPDSVVSINESAFDNCLAARSIIIGSNVEYIAYNAFNDINVTEFINNSTLDEIENDYWGASVFDIITDDGICIKDNEVKKYLNNGTDVVIPDGVLSIGEQVFYNKYGTSYLRNVTIPDSVSVIKKEAFYNCNKLNTVTIGNGLTSIQQDAFCTFNTYVSYYIYATTPPSVEGDIFYTRASYVKNIYVPAESVEAYKTASFWSKYASIIQPITD